MAALLMKQSSTNRLEKFFFEAVSQKFSFKTVIKKLSKRQTVHCVKCVQIRSFFWSIFSRNRTEYGEIRSTYTWKGVKETFLTISFFCVMVRLIWGLRHKFFISLRFRQILNLRPSADFYKNLRSAADKFVHSAVCSSAYAPSQS